MVVSPGVMLSRGREPGPGKAGQEEGTQAEKAGEESARPGLGDSESGSENLGGGRNQEPRLAAARAGEGRRGHWKPGRL